MLVKKHQLELDMEQWTGSKLGKEYVKVVLFNLYVEYIMQNAGLDEAQAGIKISMRNINNLIYADDTTMAESEDKPKILLMKVQEESKKAGLKLNIKKMKIMASSPIASWQIDGGNNGNSERLYFLGLQNHCSW